MSKHQYAPELLILSLASARIFDIRNQIFLDNKNVKKRSRGAGTSCAFAFCSSDQLDLEVINKKRNHAENNLSGLSCPLNHFQNIRFYMMQPI